jgi:peptidylprolyl isomerase
MSDARVFLSGLTAVGAAVAVAAFVFVQSSPAALAQDGAGPNLVLEVAGEAEGRIVIDLLPELAPKHVEQISTLAKRGDYDNVVFHRVIDGFMAQTGDVSFGKAGGDLTSAGMGGSDLPDLPAEFSAEAFDRGVVGMARSNAPDSANSQFFIMFAPGDFLNGQYTVVGRVVEGIDVVDAIKKGDAAGNGAVADPDRIVKATIE